MESSSGVFGEVAPNTLEGQIAAVNRWIEIARRDHVCAYSLTEASRSFTASGDRRSRIPIVALVPYGKRPIAWGRNARGIRVGGVHAASTDPEFVAELWPRWRERERSYNIGVVPQGRFVVLDIDASLDEIDPAVAAEVCRLIFETETPVHVTAGGKLHVFTQAPLGVTLETRIRCWPGVDFLGTDRLIVVPPSVASSKAGFLPAPYVPLRRPYAHPREFVQLLTDGLAPFPAPLIEILNQSTKSRTRAFSASETGGHRGNRGGGCPRGERYPLGELTDTKCLQLASCLVDESDLDGWELLTKAYREVSGSHEGWRNSAFYSSALLICRLLIAQRVTSRAVVELAREAESRGLSGKEVASVLEYANRAADRSGLLQRIEWGLTGAAQRSLLDRTANGEVVSCDETNCWWLLFAHATGVTRQELFQRPLAPQEYVWLRRLVEKEPTVRERDKAIYVSSMRLNVRGRELKSSLDQLDAALRVVDADSLGLAPCSD